MAVARKSISMKKNLISNKLNSLVKNDSQILTLNTPDKLVTKHSKKNSFYNESDSSSHTINNSKNRRLTQNSFELAKDNIEDL